MKALLPKRSPFRYFYLFMVGILLTAQAKATELPCSNIHEFIFSNDHESVQIENGENYISEDLPSHFYVEAVTGHVGSVKFTVTNLDTGQTYQITENLEPYTFPAGGGDWNLGSGNFRVKAVVYKFNYALGPICDSQTIEFSLDAEETCEADAGTLTADASNVTLDANGTATISATSNGDSNVPDGYSTVYVLTQGDGLVIVNAGASPSFEVTEAGNYTIHTLIYDANTLDLGIVELGVTTGFDVNGLLIQGGGMICASLDVAGAPVHVSSCDADAGTLTADASNVTLDANGTATISATPNGDSNVSDGYSTVYVLTQGDGLVIVNAGASPSFEVTEAGNYTIHTLIYDANTLDLGIVELGVTTGFDVNGLLIQGGGSICASLDVAGAPVTVTSCEANAGTLTATSSEATLDANGTATISATANGDANVPDGYSNIYVLTRGSGLVIVNAGASPSFEVSEAGDYTIHSLVYDPNTLDLGIVELGVTTGFDVNGLLIQGGGSICASLDVAGAPVTVNAEAVCEADAGTLYSSHPISCADNNGIATLSAEVVNAPVIPDGYQQLYVLTRAFSLTILDVSSTPEFEINQPGFYRIHSLVYDPSTLDLSIVELGVTTGFDVVGLLQQGGGEICASLDVHGALNLVLPEWICNFFYNYYSAEMADEAVLIEDLMSTFGSYEALEESLNDQSLSIKTYPNPAVNELNLFADLRGDEAMTIYVIDVMGRTVDSVKLDNTSMNNNRIRMDLTDYSSGTYLLRFKSNYRDVTKKIVVTK